VGKSNLLKPKHSRFLRFYASGMDCARAYMEAGFKCKNLEVAVHAGSRLLRTIEANLDWRDTLSHFLPDTDVALVLQGLMHSRSESTRTQIMPTVVSVKGWKRDGAEAATGFPIIIQSGSNVQINAGSGGNVEEDGTPKELNPGKPKALLR
jgi:hypothetical protein